MVKRNSLAVVSFALAINLLNNISLIESRRGHTGTVVKLPLFQVIAVYTITYQTQGWPTNPLQNTSCKCTGPNRLGVGIGSYEPKGSCVTSQATDSRPQAVCVQTKMRLGICSEKHSVFRMGQGLTDNLPMRVSYSTWQLYRNTFISSSAALVSINLRLSASKIKHTIKQTKPKK